MFLLGTHNQLGTTFFKGECVSLMSSIHVRLNMVLIDPLFSLVDNYLDNIF